MSLRWMDAEDGRNFILSRKRLAKWFHLRHRLRGLGWYKETVNEDCDSYRADHHAGPPRTFEGAHSSAFVYGLLMFFEIVLMLTTAFVKYRHYFGFHNTGICKDVTVDDHTQRTDSSYVVERQEGCKWQIPDMWLNFT
ncbi:uncharacterized protein HD556DRAFT_1306610 [Suillus plorans]|uniref:Uncharacterized protein n=1 Tax=Suillus plorans TaxID=116603 RepID=A0A9P7DL33_9AGAM|nr:uncharacterized protein HD556DRAFT_1306610 [Suillus plorans]KAG1797479.1 hypothetical protein HD556DRAFT_1306610 [Suillus plorans]